MGAHHPKLTSAEIAALWTAYMNNSMSRCVLGYFLKDVSDHSIQRIAQYSYDISVDAVIKVTQFFQSEGLPIPIGFSDEDVNLKAPRLYTDTFIIHYIENMGKAGLVAYSGFVSMSVRKDIRTFFGEKLEKTFKLLDRSVELLAENGLLVRAPFINYPTTVDEIDSNRYFSGLFSKKRPLNSIEIGYLYMNIQTNVLGSKLALSFAQASPTEKIQNFMLKGADISKKHIKHFTEFLQSQDIQPAASPDIMVTDSTISPFSDKLMMFHMSLLNALGVANYATAAAASQRNDLALNYEKASFEIGLYAKEGATIMIDHAWLEQPPPTKDKRELAKEKGNTN